MSKLRAISRNVIVPLKEEVKVNQEDPLEVIFQVLFQESSKVIDGIIKEDQKLNANGRKAFVIPLLERAGISTFKELESEIGLIIEKRSALGKSVREAVMEVFVLCMDIHREIEVDVKVGEEEA